MRRLLLATLLALALAPGAAGAADDPWPTRPVRFVVPFTPGGSTDIIARLVGQKLGEALGQSFVIDNRPGAGGTIGAELVARAAPDGYTLLMGHIGTLAVNPGLYANLPYDPTTSFAPVALAAIVANVLVVHPSVPAASVAELVALAKAKPDALTYGSGGNGSAAHIAMTAFLHATGTRMVHVPYRGTAPMVNDLLAGQLSLTMTGGPAVLPQVRGGALRALGVSSPQRIAAAPDLPTIAEAGLPGFDATQWYGVVAPAKTPEPIVARLNQAINAALGQPEIMARLKDEGAYPEPGSPADFGRLIAAEIARWGALIRATGIKPD